LRGSLARRFAVNAGLVAGSVAFTLLVLELAARLLLGDGYLIGKQILTLERRHHHAPGNRGADCFPSNPAGTFHEVDPARWEGALLIETMHYQPIPRVLLRHTPYCVEFTNNRSGFRGRDFTAERAPGSFRVVVLGDSFTYGVGVADAETLPAQLESILSQHSGDFDVEVINLGEPGIETARELAHLRKHRELRPDVVVLAYVLNDASRAEGVGQRDPAADLVMLRPQHLEGGTSAQSESALIRFVQHRLARRRAHTRTLAAYRETFDPEVNAEGLAETEAVLRELQAEVEARGAQLLIALYPILYQLGDDYPLEAAHRKLGEIFDRLGIPWIDVRTAAFADQNAKALRVHPLDHHPNALAHGLAARAIADELIRRGLLVPRDPAVR
jgi:lysophospholipase L1-like esterase